MMSLHGEAAKEVLGHSRVEAAAHGIEKRKHGQCDVAGNLVETGEEEQVSKRAKR